MAVSQVALKRELRALLKLKGNTNCADCPARKPTWASINLGVFLCLNCAGIHRDLGVHISKVRSVDLDTWQEEWVVVMKQWGNIRVNSQYEARLPQGVKPTEEESQRLGLKMRKFIRDKYEKKAFFSASDAPLSSSKASFSKPLDTDSVSFDGLRVRHRTRPRKAEPISRSKSNPAPLPDEDLLSLDLFTTTAEAPKKTAPLAGAEKHKQPNFASRVEVRSNVHRATLTSKPQAEANEQSQGRRNSETYEDKAKRVMAMFGKSASSSVSSTNNLFGS